MSNTNNITISADSVKEFKGIHCDENPIIVDLLKKEFLTYFNEPIMDVGGGTADILTQVIPEKKVIHLDVLDFSDVQIPDEHVRVTGDFFDNGLIQKFMPIQTLFMSHVLQFIDSDISRLNSIIESIDARTIIMVEDMNNDFLGEVMNFSLAHFSNANPEVLVQGFPTGYTKTKSVPFTATLSGSNFTELTKQCLYLMDVEHSEKNITDMNTFLESRLQEPKFTINQEINVYQK